MKFSLVVPDTWDNNQKGDFFEKFVGNLLKPMRYEVTQRIQFTGMEIDLLAKGIDAPRKIFVECKAQSDSVTADIISKILGDSLVKHADAAWLFSTSDLSRGGRGKWEEIQEDPDLKTKFTWYPPERICDILISQEKVKDPKRLEHLVSGFEIGDWTLVVGPSQWLWLSEFVESGVPTSFSAFDARNGKQLSEVDSEVLGSLWSRFEPLRYLSPAREKPVEHANSRVSLARVLSGDTWEDLRPARPTDFVGRDNIIDDIFEFFRLAKDGRTTTRSFAIQAPSGWGKSSLILKLVHISHQSRMETFSITAIDSRSATSSAFIAEAVHLAFKDAENCGLIDRRGYRVSSIQHPFFSPELEPAYETLRNKGGLIVLIFDQFEELFAKEDLFEAFNAIRELSLDLDGNQLPVVLGFAWKTDIALPQQHPAYYLWHQLKDRRKTFQVPKFGGSEIKKVIGKAERALNKRLSGALKTRLVDQCQGWPWLLKKLLVHVLQRVTTPESQYLLLERELDIELLFKEDLAILPDMAVSCLRYIAQSAPVAVSEIEESFDRKTTNLLLDSHIIVRSGMNYVIYWDIFRDYLVEGRVPKIPWARTFQRYPTSAVKALKRLSEIGKATIPQLARELGFREGPCFNLMSDLVALQLVDRVSGDSYQLTSILPSAHPMDLAQYARKQLERHIVMQVITSDWDKSHQVNSQEWETFFAKVQPRSSELSSATIRQYANNLRRWLLFAGLLEETGDALHRPQDIGSRIGLAASQRGRGGFFMGNSSPIRIRELLIKLIDSEPIERSELGHQKLRNAINDALSLQLVSNESDGRIQLGIPKPPIYKLNSIIRNSLANDKTIQYLKNLIDEGEKDPLVLGNKLESFLGTTWTETSKLRNINGLLRFIRWTFSEEQGSSSDEQINLLSIE